jgi:hypothetical protein
VMTRDLHDMPMEEVGVVVDARNVSQQAIAGLTQWAEAIDLEQEKLRFRVRSRDVLPDIMRFLVASGADIFEVTPEHISLEQIFVTIMGEDTSL